MQNLHLHNDQDLDYPEVFGAAYEANLSSIALGGRLVSLTACGVDGSALLVALASCPLKDLHLSFLVGTLEVAMAVFIGPQSRARSTLQFLDFGNCHRLSEAAVACIGKLPKLHALRLSDCLSLHC